MTDDLLQPTPEPTPENPPIETSEVAQKPKRSRKKLWIALVVILITGICGCLIGAGIIAGNLMKDRAPIEAVLDTYMKFMLAKDTESAYALLSTRARQEIPISKLEEMVNGNNYLIFEGYKSLSIQNIQLAYILNLDPNASQGGATVSGNTYYEDGTKGTFNGTLEKFNGIWQINSIYLRVPIDKLQP